MFPSVLDQCPSPSAKSVRSRAVKILLSP